MTRRLETCRQYQNIAGPENLDGRVGDLMLKKYDTPSPGACGEGS